MIILLFLCLGLKLSHWLLAHETIFQLSHGQKRSIKKDGVYHYTTIESAKIIVKEQKLIGMRDYKSTFPSHREDKIIWFFGRTDTIFERFLRWCVLKRHSPKMHSGKNHSIKYETKLLIRSISDEQISKMKINIEMGIGCYVDEMSNVTISFAPLDKIDRILGVKTKRDGCKGIR